MESRKFGMNYGAVLGLFLIFFAVVFWSLGLDNEQSIVPSIVNNLVIISFISYAIMQYRDKINNGYISYSHSLRLGTTVAFFSSIIMALYTFFYMNYLNPDMVTDVMNMTEYTILESDPNISDEELDIALSMTAKLMQPHWMMLTGVLAGTFMGFLYSLVISFFTKREDLSQIS